MVPPAEACCELPRTPLRRSSHSGDSTKFALTWFTEVLSQPQHHPQHQEGEVHTLRRVEDDGHPRAPVAIGGVSVQKSGEKGVRYSPGLVNVIETEEYAVGHPAPASEYAFHLGQEHAPKKKLLSQDRVERGANDEQGEEPPGALQPRQDLLRLEDRIEAVARWLRKKRKDRHPSVFQWRVQ